MPDQDRLGIGTFQPEDKKKKLFRLHQDRNGIETFQLKDEKNQKGTCDEYPDSTVYCVDGSRSPKINASQPGTRGRRAVRDRWAHL